MGNGKLQFFSFYFCWKSMSQSASVTKLNQIDFKVKKATAGLKLTHIPHRCSAERNSCLVEKKLFPPGSLGEILQMGAVWRCEGWKQNIKIIIFWLLNVASPLLCVIFVPVQWQRADRRMNEWRLRKREWMILNSAAASEWVSKELNWNEFFLLEQC